MQLSDARKQQGLRQSDVATELQAAGYPWMDTPAIIKVERLQLLPIPPVAQEMCRIYNIPINQIYGPHGLKYPFANDEKRRTGKTPDTVYKLTGGIPIEDIGDRETFRAMITACGYESISHWMRHNVRNLRRQYRRKQKSAPASVAAETDAVQKSTPQVYHVEGGCQDVPDMPSHAV